MEERCSTTRVAPGAGPPGVDHHSGPPGMDHQGELLCAWVWTARSGPQKWTARNGPPGMAHLTQVILSEKSSMNLTFQTRKNSTPSPTRVTGLLATKQETADSQLGQCTVQLVPHYFQPAVNSYRSNSHGRGTSGLQDTLGHTPGKGSGCDRDLKK